jgi:hypothetical protein
MSEFSLKTERNILLERVKQEYEVNIKIVLNWIGFGLNSTDSKYCPNASSCRQGSSSESLTLWTLPIVRDSK